MFGNDERDRRIKNLEDIVSGYSEIDHKFNIKFKSGHSNKIEDLYKKHQKLKAIVAELVDYVYSKENK